MRVILALAVILIAGLVIGLSCDKATEPVETELNDYPVYFWGGDYSNLLYTYYAASGRLDSAEIEWQAYRGVTVSADGKRLYLSTREKVVVVDTDSLGLITELPYLPRSPVAVSPDNQLVAVTGDNLHILRTSDYSVVFSDTGRTRYGVFSVDSKTFYCSHRSNSGGSAYAYVVDLSDSTFPVTRKTVGGYVVQIIPTVDESKWVLNISGGNYVWAIEIYDVLEDSVVFIYEYSPCCGWLTLTPDTRYGYFGSPGSLLEGPFPPSVIYVLDVDAGQISDQIPTTYFVDSLTPDFFPVGNSVVTPDGRWLVATDGPAPQRLIRYDMEHNRLVDYREFPRSMFYYLTVQNTP